MLSLETYYTEQAIEQSIHQSYLLLAKVITFTPDSGREKEQGHRYPENRKTYYKYSVEQVQKIEDLRLAGKTWREIAAIIGLPESNVYATWYRNRHRLNEGGCV